MRKCVLLLAQVFESTRKLKGLRVYVMDNKCLSPSPLCGLGRVT